MVPEQPRKNGKTTTGSGGEFPPPLDPSKNWQWVEPGMSADVAMRKGGGLAFSAVDLARPGSKDKSVMVTVVSREDGTIEVTGERDLEGFAEWHRVACPMALLRGSYVVSMRGLPNECSNPEDAWADGHAPVQWARTGKRPEGACELRTGPGIDELRAGLLAAFEGQSCVEAFEDFVEWRAARMPGTWMAPLASLPTLVVGELVKAWLAYELKEEREYQAWMDAETWKDAKGMRHEVIDPIRWRCAMCGKPPGGLTVMMYRMPDGREVHDACRRKEAEQAGRGFDVVVADEFSFPVMPCCEGGSMGSVHECRKSAGKPEPKDCAHAGRRRVCRAPLGGDPDGSKTVVVEDKCVDCGAEFMKSRAKEPEQFVAPKYDGARCPCGFPDVYRGPCTMHGSADPKAMPGFTGKVRLYAGTAKGPEHPVLAEQAGENLVGKRVEGCARCRRRTPGRSFCSSCGDRSTSFELRPPETGW